MGRLQPHKKKNRQTILIISFKFHEKYMFYHLKIQD